MAVRVALGIDAQDDLTCALVAGLEILDDRLGQIQSLVGLENLIGLWWLTLESDLISDISPLGGLRGLTTLQMRSAQIIDISPVSALTSLTRLVFVTGSIVDVSAVSGLTSLSNLDFSSNADLSDIQPVFDNPGIAVGDTVHLVGTSVTCMDVDALRARGVTVFWICLTDQ